MGKGEGPFTRVCGFEDGEVYSVVVVSHRKVSTPSYKFRTSDKVHLEGRWGLSLK